MTSHNSWEKLKTMLYSIVDFFADHSPLVMLAIMAAIVTIFFIFYWLLGFAEAGKEEIDTVSSVGIKSQSKLGGIFSKLISGGEAIKQKKTNFDEEKKISSEETDDENKQVHDAVKAIIGDEHDDIPVGEEVLQQDIDSGIAIKDKKSGVIYTQAPNEVDDLTKIWGVGSYLNNKLNDFGVYKFKQIATWNANLVEEFSNRLDHFQFRVVRDRWVAQAKSLHEKKYGEKIN